MLRASHNVVGEMAVQAALTSGEWYVDNNHLTEQLSLAGKVNKNSNTSGVVDTVQATSLNAISLSGPKLVPIKSFQNELLNLSVSIDFTHEILYLKHTRIR